MKKHGVILDIRNDWISYWLGHYKHDVSLRFFIAEPQAEKPCDKKLCVEPLHAGKQHTEKPHAEKPHASRPMRILKQTSNGLPELLLLYLFPSTQGVSKVAKTPEAVKLEKKKKKPSTIPQKPKPNTKGEAKVEDKKPSVEQADSKPLDLALIDGALFIRLAKSKKPKHRAGIVAILMQDIEYQLNKVMKPLTDPKTVVPVKYHDFIDVFSKETSDKLSPHTKFDHKIKLLKDKGKLGHSALRGMSVPQLEFVKKFLEKHLKKGFIEASSAPCSSPILLAKKPGGGIRFCVDVRVDAKSILW